MMFKRIIRFLLLFLNSYVNFRVAGDVWMKRLGLVVVGFLVINLMVVSWFLLGKDDAKQPIVLTASENLKIVEARTAYGTHKRYDYTDEWEISGPQPVETREYQLKLNSEEWLDRDAHLSDFINTFNNISSFIKLSLEESQENAREQIYIDRTENCGKVHTIRIRNYMWGFQAGFSSIDVKTVSQQGIESVIDKSMSPMKNKAATSIQKLEKGTITIFSFNK
jgi:hypothetical protein